MTNLYLFMFVPVLEAMMIGLKPDPRKPDCVWNDFPFVGTD